MKVRMWGAGILGGILALELAQADTHYTPRAGEEYRMEVDGKPITVPARDRRQVTAIDIGLVWTPDAPGRYEHLPFGAVFVWRNLSGGKERFRGILMVSPQVRT